jgi:hypothetical protein
MRRFRKRGPLFVTTLLSLALTAWLLNLQLRWGTPDVIASPDLLPAPSGAHGAPIVPHVASPVAAFRPAANHPHLVPHDNSPTSTTTPTATITSSPTQTQTSSATTTSSATPTTTNTPTVTPTLTPVISYYLAEGYTGSLTGTNNKAAFTEVINMLNPTGSPAAVTISYYTATGGTPQIVNAVIPPASVLCENVNNDVGADKIISAVVASPAKIYVTRTITRSGGTNSRLDGSTTLPASVPSKTWSFAEGYTGITFQEYLAVFNPSSSQANVTIQTAPQAASATGAPSQSVQVPAFSRATVNIRALFSSAQVKSVGLIVSSDQPVVAERVEYFGDGIGSGKFGATVSSGITVPSTQWRIPFGSSGGGTVLSNGKVQNSGDEHYVTILNPTTGSSVQVTASYADASGHPLGQSKTITIAGGTRQTIISNGVVGAGAVSPFSVALGATGPIAVEGAQYFGGSPNVGTHPGVVVPASSIATTDAFFSALSTTLPDGTAITRKVYLYNPGTSSVQVSATYFPGIAAGAGGTATVTATPSASATVSPTASATTTSTPANTSTSTATSTPTSTATASATQTTSPTPSITETPGGPADTSTATVTSTVTNTPTSTATGTATLTPTATGTSTVTSTATSTATTTPMATATPVTFGNSYTVPAGGILAVNVNADAGNAQGPVGAEFKLAAGSSGSFIAYSVGTTGDSLSATEDSAVPAF